MQIDVQFNPAAAPWPLLRDATLAAEGAGFGAVWVLDHLAGVSMRGDGMLECFTCLGALATSTTTIELGTLVANVWNREPGVLAVAAASVCEIAGRPLLLGLGAGTSPTSPFAAEQHAVGATIGATLTERHDRVVVALDLIDAMFDPDRPAHFATFPLPHHRPTTLLGVNSVRLATIAGARAGGINVWWSHPRRDEFLAASDAAHASRAADESTGSSPPTASQSFLRTAYEWWDDALFDPGHPARLAMADAGIHRLILAEIGAPDPGAIARRQPNAA
jgi:alkanesulfonate monooxygenase SsuD/methylene tetrahydromethanopterin reductase-like flavin-dependent oxidoreductase (luciferase family)